jgi:lipopolysaccharide export system permease protein
VQRGAGLAEQEFVLYEGRRYEGVPGSKEWRIVEFREHGIAVRLPDVRAKKARQDVKITSELRASTDPDDRAELAWRRAVPAMLVTLALLAVPLAKLRPRQGRFGRIGVAVIAYFAYSNLLAAARVWVEKDEPIGALGLWWVHTIPIALAAWLLWRETQPRAVLLRRLPWTLRKASA